MIEAEFATFACDATMLSTKASIEAEVLHFTVNCPRCHCILDTNMKFVDVPHFQEVCVMATVCESCGYRNTEVKAGGEIGLFGTKYTLFITSKDDLNRDVLKSETCAVEIPELELEVGMGALGGRLTTVEGILVEMCDQLAKHSNFLTGDEMAAIVVETKDQRAFAAFLQQFKAVISGEMPAHLILNDCLGRSCIQRLADSDQHLTMEAYTRTWEQDEELGINDMKTEDYAEPEDIS